MGLNQFCVMQIPAFISKPDPDIRQQQHVPTPSGPTSADMAVKTELCVKTLSSYNTTLSPQDYFMNTDTTWFSFPTFLGLPQDIQSRNDDYAAVVYDTPKPSVLLSLTPSTYYLI